MTLPCGSSGYYIPLGRYVARELKEYHRRGYAGWCDEVLPFDGDFLPGRNTKAWQKNVLDEYIKACFLWNADADYDAIFTKDKPIIFIGATNYPNQVDNAMLDRVELVRVPFPDLEARTYSFEKHFEKMFTLEDGFTFQDMAAATDTYNYRDIKRLVSRIKNIVLKDVMRVYKEEKKAVSALAEGEYRLTREIFRKAQESCLPTPKEDIIKELDEWEEKFKRNISEEG